MKLQNPFLEGDIRILKDKCVEDVIREILHDPGQDDAFMVLDVGDIVQKIKNWRLKMPRVKPFYAVKCNTNKTVLKVLAALGTGFDCASKAEMKKILDLGVDPSRIIFAHTCKPKSHILQAAVYGVQTMTFDSEEELYKIKVLNPTAKLVLRIRCDAVAAQCPLGIKFGANPKNITPLLKTAKSLGLNVVGVSFHVGSGCLEPQVYLRAIKRARETFDEAIGMGFNPYLLDIGGGFPGTTGTSLDETAEYVNEGLEQYFPDEDVEIIAEPGRYVVASAFTLLTQVTSKRRIEATADSELSFYYYINDGVYGSFNCILFDHQVVHPELFHPLTNKVDEKKSLFHSTIWGPSCDSMDQIFEDILLPEMDIGQWIMWKDMGAYTIAASSTFNGFPVPWVHVVSSFHTWVSLRELLADDSVTNSQVTSEEEVDVAPPGQDQQLFSSVPNFLLHIDKDQESLLDHMSSCLNMFEIS